jgi:hypothetical protein
MVSENFSSTYSVSTPSQKDVSSQHLQAELARLDDKLQRAVRRWQLAGQDTNDAFRGLYLGLQLYLLPPSATSSIACTNREARSYMSIRLAFTAKQ